MWTNGIGLSRPGTAFTISVIAAGISLCSIIVAGLTYIIANEALRREIALLAYILLLLAIGIIIVQTGQNDSPFLILWMAAAIFSGIFGPIATVSLLIMIAGYTAWCLFDGQSFDKLLPGTVLAGFLPLIISFVLWHGKSTAETTKELALHELANELDQVSNKAEVVIGAISDGVIAINDQGQIELINPAAQQIVGWGNQDALTLDYKSVLHLLTKTGSEVEKADDPILQVLTTNQPIKRDDLQVQTNSGKKLTIEIVVSPIGYIGSGAIIVFRDITKEQAEERAQAEFISTASHEMRTPVASIEGYLGLVLNPATATIDNKARDFVTKAHEAAQHLGRLFQDLLDVTKAEDGRLSNNPKVIDVVRFTSDIIEGLKPKADQKGLRLFFKPLVADTGMRMLEPIFYVDVDADHLRETLSNLLENAIKYTPAGEVVINITGDDDYVTISIADSGIGIPAEDIPHLFQKFYRVDNSDTREIGGTGLGLYLVRRLVETMGGRVWVNSEYKKGSTFSIELPRISHQEATRLIEAMAVEGAQPTIPNSNPAIVADHHSQALTTPIIMDKRDTVTPTPKPVAATTPAPVAQPAPAPAVPKPAPVTAPKPVPVNIPAPAIPRSPSPMTVPVPPAPKPVAAPTARSTPATPVAPARPSATAPVSAAAPAPAPMPVPTPAPAAPQPAPVAASTPAPVPVATTAPAPQQNQKT